MFRFSEVAIHNMTANVVNVHFAKNEAVSISFQDPEIKLNFNGKLVASFLPVACNELSEVKTQVKEFFESAKKVIAQEMAKQD